MKKLVSIILTLASILAFTACGGNGAPEDASDTGGAPVPGGAQETNTPAETAPGETSDETDSDDNGKNTRTLYAINDESIAVYSIDVPDGIETKPLGSQLKLFAADGVWVMQISATEVDPGNETYIMAKTRMEGTKYTLVTFSVGGKEGFYYQSSGHLIQFYFPSLVSDDENAPYGVMGLFGPMNKDGNFIEGDVIQFLDDPDVQAILGSIRAPGI